MPKNESEKETMTTADKNAEVDKSVAQKDAVTTKEASVKNNPASDGKTADKKTADSITADKKMEDGKTTDSTTADKKTTDRKINGNDKVAVETMNNRAGLAERRSSGQEKGTPKKEKESKKSQVIRFTILLVLVAAVVLAFYIRLTNQSKNSNQQAEENLTEVGTLMNYDLANSYPKVARDVVKLHCRFLKSIYNEELDDSELQELNAQTRQLYAQDLLAENTEAKQFSDLKNEVEEFQGAGKIYISYTVDAEENVKYSEIDGVEYAIVYVNCKVKESDGTATVQEQYLLVKENEQWKILGWQGIVIDNTATEE